MSHRSISKYLIYLHETNIADKGAQYLNAEIPIYVDSEKADKSPGDYPVGAVVTTSVDEVDDGKVLIVSKDNMKLPTSVDEVAAQLDEIQKKNAPLDSDWRVTKKSFSKGEQTGKKK